MGWGELVGWGVTGWTRDIPEVIDISPRNLDSSLCFFQSSVSLMMYSVYKLNKQGDNIQP